MYIRDLLFTTFSGYFNTFCMHNGKHSLH